MISPYLFEIDGQSVGLKSALLTELQQSFGKLLAHFFQVPAIDMQSAVRALITSAVSTLHRVTGKRKGGVELLSAFDPQLGGILLHAAAAAAC